MVSSDQLVFLILSTVAFLLVAESCRTIMSDEEKQELVKQLKCVNKPAIKSFQTDHGDILDCILLHNQLAFDHPLLKNRSVQMRPATIPEWITDNNNTSQKSGFLKFLQGGISCPNGTVIVKRTTMQDLIHAKCLKSMGLNYPRYVPSKGKNIDVAGHHFAVTEYRYLNYGAKGNLNIWDPEVLADQFSLSCLSIAGGPKAQLNSISAGWIVNPWLYLGHSRLYTYWTADGFKKTGCFSTQCPGFVQVSSKIPLGILIKPVSSYGGRQFEIDISMHQDRATGDWWLVLNDEYIGYWPKSLFTASGLAEGASFVSWGGEVYSPVTEKSPSMGSGHFPDEGFRKAAYVNGLKVIASTGQAITPTSYSLKTFSDSPKCYRAEYKPAYGEWSSGIFYGGPGGCTF
ncbi:PREDICTED: uncharacterized protein LOC104806411 isoform X2 [Tarenaya hassleriana]|uniref:uncharacterized protein LOC104806411 isoform X2 n=1 Tax=Tarenaya hassleriana TaxID=28532 RepID=UPI0008FD2310|nr:PREDICTED: uncharacterized protein LOC104806411 isoform X2 [Tarenaya hassleriana]